MRSPLGRHMEAEIADTPAALERLLAESAWWAPPLVAALRRCRGVAFVARGTSDHAASYARYLVEQAYGVPSWSVAPSQSTRYETAIDVRGLGLVAISQSGRTPEILSVVDAWRDGGAVAVGVTNDASSALAGAVELVVPLRSGPEVAVPATKTFTSTLAVAAMLAASAAPERFAVDRAAIVGDVAAAVATPEAVAGAADALVGASVAVHFGRGYLLPLAREAALKTIESARLPTFAWSPVDFRHGPFALAGPGTVAVIHNAGGPVGADAAELTVDLAGVGATVITVGEAVAGVDAIHVPIPGAQPEFVRPLLHAVRIQQLALELARRRGIDPDAPPGLNKVTATH